jgi:anti-anti-sigma regulatory factor
VPRVPFQQARGCLIASLQLELSELALTQFRADLLDRVRAVQPTGVVLDISGLPLFDRHEFGALRRAMDMVRLMGCPTVLVGVQPGMAAAIAETDERCDELLTARNLEEAFALLGCHT